MGAPETLPANFSGWDSPAASAGNAPPATLPANFSGWDDAKDATATPKLSGFWDTLKREGKSLTGAIAGMPAAVYHAFSEPATAEEKKEFGGDGQVSGAKRVGLGVYRLGIAPVETAVDWYSDAAKGKIPNAYEQALSVAPEGIGSAAGSVIAGKGAGSAVEAAPKVVSAVGDAAPAIVRGVAKGTNAVLQRAPGVVGSAAGAAIGHASGIPEAGVVGAVLGNALGKEVLPTLKVPGEEFGLPADATKENVPYAGEENEGLRQITQATVNKAIPPEGDTLALNKRVQSQIDNHLAQGDVAAAENVLDTAAKTADPKWTPPDRPRITPSVQNIRETDAQVQGAEAAPNRPTPDSMEDRALQQEMNQDLERHGWAAESEARREFIARNSTGVTKSDLTGVAEKPVKYTKTPGVPSPGSGVGRVPTSADDLMDLLQQSLDAAKKSKGSGND